MIFVLLSQVIVKAVSAGKSPGGVQPGEGNSGIYGDVISAKGRMEVKS